MLRRLVNSHFIHFFFVLKLRFRQVGVQTAVISELLIVGLATANGPKGQMFGVDFWFELAGEVQRVMAKYSKDLYKSSAVFSDQLFGGYVAIFTAHALTQYVALGRNTDPKFKPAVDLFFG
ncbi:hypothetical protein [Mucilaginibacter sp. AK015]|uniref:hypothetical protein n=1 Tax=Mucilaginibacter sp. AK015 TaxID=2723072 RepID=UPI0016100BA9|nr:hypothetical protein [Mucilaginibacter sp. AK015]MBB5395190.1 hypothetical protein [Mucilaginibacter sp. AK015]